MSTILIEGIPDDGRAERMVDLLRSMLPADLVVSTVTEEVGTTDDRVAA